MVFGTRVAFFFLIPMWEVVITACAVSLSKSKKVSNYQSTKCYTKYQELIEQDITHFGKCEFHLWRKGKCHALPHRFDIGTTKSVPLSATI
jgi:hypothetical protein